MTIMYDIEPLPYCCGFVEVGAFEASDAQYEADTPEELVAHALRFAKTKPIIFNFFKQKMWTGDFKDFYEVAELRTYVMNYPGVIHLHKWINPNTGNWIDSYVITKGKD